MTSKWKEKEAIWDKNHKQSEASNPLKTIKHLPKTTHITKKTRFFLRLKALRYMLKEDQDQLFFKYFLKRPFYHFKNLIFSYLKRRPFVQKEDLFYYGFKDIKTFEKLVQDPETLFIVGFSYCQKPFECPSKRFSDQCMHDPKHPVCSQCFIGKCNFLSDKKNIEFVYIPTVHYIGEKLFEGLEKYKNRKVIFMITSCELCLKMFADWGNMLNIKGLGFRFQGRVCNTMKAFKLSENGIKPGLTLLTEDTQKKFLHFLNLRNSIS